MLKPLQMLMMFPKTLRKGFTSKPGGGMSGILGSKFWKILSIRVTSKCSLGFNVAATPTVSSTSVFYLSSFSSFGSWSLDLFLSMSDDTSNGDSSLSKLFLLFYFWPLLVSSLSFHTKTASVCQVPIITAIETVLILRFFWFVFPFSANQ